MDAYSYTLRRLHAWENRLICSAPALRTVQARMQEAWLEDLADAEYIVERWNERGAMSKRWCWGNQEIGPNKLSLTLLWSEDENRERIIHHEQLRTGLTELEQSYVDNELDAMSISTVIAGEDDEGSTPI